MKNEFTPSSDNELSMAEIEKRYGKEAVRQQVALDRKNYQGAIMEFPPQNPPVKKTRAKRGTLQSSPEKAPPRAPNKIDKSAYPLTNKYRELKGSAIEGDSNFCLPLAIAAVTGLDMKKVTLGLEKLGRIRRGGTSINDARKFLKANGFKITAVSAESFIKKYAGKHKKLNNVTTHHPDRFRSVWADERNYIFHCSKHSVGVVNGVVHDHSRGSSRRAQEIWKITKR